MENNTLERKPTWEMFNLLTKSDKYGGYCVVALRCRDNKLVRLVSSDLKTHGAIEKDTFRRRGYTMKPTDLIRIPIFGKDRSRYQPENYMVHSKRPKASFTYNGIQYSNMSFTEPDFHFSDLDPSLYTETEDGIILHRAVLVVSLPNCPFEQDNFYYIFVARVFPLAAAA